MTTPPVSPPFPAPLPDAQAFGLALAGQYTLQRELGRGGMGVVYLAHDVKLDRLVAVKTLLPHLAGDAAIRERFLREARTAGALSHPNIVPVHRADELEGHVFFVMGYVDGQSLAQRVRERGRLDPRDVAMQLRDVAGALDYAHSRGVVHRDVKAENILIHAETGRAMVTDFGIARLAEAAPLTATGQMLGTVYYLSPEQIAGEHVDGRSDIYGLGVVGYLALSGRFPFDAPLASAVLIAHVTRPPEPLSSAAPGIPAALAAVIDTCLSKNPSERFQNGQALSAALLEAVSQLEATDRDASALAPVLSDDEAQAVWARAAQLQAQTGIVPRPAPIVPARDTAADRTRTSGYRLGDVRAAGVEAGIPPQYVEHALAEHGLAAVPQRHALALQSARQDGHAVTQVVDRSRGGKWIDAATVLEFEVVLDGEVSNRDFDLLGDSIQRTIGHFGTLTEVGRSLTWQDNEDRKLQISVFAREGHTTIRATENIEQIAGGLAGGMAGGGSVGLGSGATAFVARHWGAGPAILTLTIVVSTLLVTAAAIFGTISNRKRRRLRAVVEQIADLARTSINGDRAALVRPETKKRIDRGS